MEFKINKEFADKYNSTQKKLELQKLKDKYKDGDYSSSSTSESEDDNAEALTDEIEKDWFCTLSAIIGKDPKIYDPSVTFYRDKPKVSKKEPQAKIKSLYLKDYERDILLKHEGKIPENNTLPPIVGQYDQEQQSIKEGFKPFLQSNDVDDNDDDEDIMVKRVLTNQEQSKHDEAYIEWMKGQKELTDDITIELKPLKNHWSDANVDENEKFLKDYLLNKRYLEEDDERVPTYDEIVLAEEDEKQFDEEELFAVKYNYRYEEPDQDFIKSYPRTIMTTVRAKDDKRALKRKEVKDRKDMERKKKKEELKKLKNLKKDEMLAKLARLKKVVGNAQVQLEQKDLDEDFDPEKHEAVMRKLLGEDFYEAVEHEKPKFDEDEIDDEEVDWDHWTSENLVQDDNKQSSNAIEDSMWRQSNLKENLVERSRKKRKRKSKFEAAIEKAKPLFDPKSKTFDDYFDEYYNLDYEDIVGDQTCRFRYRAVVPNDYGLSTDEILKAREKELNAWVSVKKMSQYRTEEEEAIDVKEYKKKQRKKYNIITSLNTNLSDDYNQSNSKSFEKIKKIDDNNTNLSTNSSDSFKLSNDTTREPKKKKSKMMILSQDLEDKITDCSLAEKTITKSKKKKQKKIKIADDLVHKNITTPLVSQSNGASVKNTGKVSKVLKEDGEVDNSFSMNGELKKKKVLSDSLTTVTAEKTKKNKTKKKKYLSDKRLAAYKIDPNKFKYFYLPKLNSHNKT